MLGFVKFVLILSLVECSTFYYDDDPPPPEDAVTDPAPESYPTSPVFNHEDDPGLDTAVATPEMLDFESDEEVRT